MEHGPAWPHTAVSDLHRAIVESSPDGIWIFDLEGRVSYANPRVAEMFGVPVDELAGLTVFDTLDEEGREQFRAHLEQLRAGRYNDDEVEVRFVRRDRTAFWVSVQESPLTRLDGSLAGVVHRMSDYSRRRAAVDELRSSRAQLAEAQRIARLGSWTWDPTTDRVEASDEFVTMFGFTRQTFPASLTAFLELVHPDDRQLVVEQVTAALEGRDELDYIARVRIPAGWRWARARGVVHRRPDGTVLMSGTHQDVTEVTEARHALEDQVAQNMLLQAVAATANEAATLAELLPRARELLLLHDDWERARGFVPDGSGGLAPLYVTDGDPEEDLHTPEESARELALATRVLHERGPVWDDRRLTIAFPVWLDDEVCAVITMTSAPPLYRHEMIQSNAEQVAVQIGRVAERERAQRELADARDQAMAASRQKSEFLATMSHEIRTPLNGILGLTDLLVRSGLDPARHRLASGAQLAGRTLLSLINDVLDFSKIEAGRLELEHVDFEVREVLDQVTGILAEPAREKGLDLLVSCHPEVPDLVRGDPTRLAQVLTNLGSNAVKFTDAGQVEVRATASPAGDRVRLCLAVRDTGCGLDPERLPALFEPFTQGDASTTRVHGGTGLGLAISREIVQAMDGEVEVHSRPGEGSTFRVSVLLDPPEAGSVDSSDRRARSALAGHRVLVVDDHDERRAVLLEQLTRWSIDAAGVDSLAAASSVLGEAAASEAPYELVLAGLAAPQDAELVAEVRRAAPPSSAGGPAPVVLLRTWPASGRGLDDSPEVADRPDGVADVLTQPVLGRDLRDTLLALLAGQRPATPRRRSRGAGEAGRNRRVLVVEDNPVNQLVAVGLLEARGYLADTAEDGVAAVEAYDPDRHDLVLMDVQMPRLDGYATARQLRAAEPEGRRVPIIAMTASAVDGERERCLAAGMDDYLTKPVDPGALSAALTRWLAEASADRPFPPRTGPRHQEHPVTATPDPLEGLDLDRLEMLRTLDPGNTAYLDRAIGNFCTNSATALETIRQAVAAGDAAGLRHEAHKLAGGALNLGVAGSAAAARELEYLGDAGTTEGAAELLAGLADALDEGRAALRAYQARHTDGGRPG